MSEVNEHMPQADSRFISYIFKKTTEFKILVLSIMSHIPGKSFPL